jgi:hypothetical protein
MKIEECSLTVKHGKCEAECLEDAEWILGIELENLIRDTTKLGNKCPDVDTLLPVLVRNYLKVFDTRLAYASLEVIVVPVGLGVPLGRIVHEAVVVVEMLWLFDFLQH